MSIAIFRTRVPLPSLLAAVVALYFSMLPASNAASNHFNMDSSDFPVTVVSANPEYGGLVLDVLDHGFRYFAVTMGVKSFAPMRFRFLLEEQPPADVNQAMEALYYSRSVTLGNKMEFTIQIPSHDFNPVALVRTAMLCQLQALVLKNKEWNSGKQMQVQAPPFWLTEGLTQGFLDKKTPSLEKIITRINRSGPVPPLETVQGWTELSPHRLEQWWQEACCYWLVKKATAKVSDREALGVWLTEWFTSQGRPYWENNEENEVWWKKTLGEKGRQVSPVTNEEQTRVELEKCLKFKARLKGEDVDRDYSLADLPKPPLEFTSSKPFEGVMDRLLLLQARGNFLWQDVIEGYRIAYSLWLKGKYLDYQKEIARAESGAESVSEYMKKARDYLNWYEVNNPAAGPKFSTLLRQSLAFEDAQELEHRDKAEIAAQLTLIESGK